MDITEFETVIKARTDNLVDDFLADKDKLGKLYANRMANPVQHPWTHINIDSRLRFFAAMQPHTIVGDDYAHSPYKYDEVMERIRIAARERLGKETYKELWKAY